eukprot:7853101-Karenia_brevis.AAC.1
MHVSHVALRTQFCSSMSHVASWQSLTTKIKLHMSHHGDKGTLIPMAVGRVDGRNSLTYRVQYIPHL